MQPGEHETDSQQFSGLILASALITLDGTAATIVLPAIGREFSASIETLQWVMNAPLLALAALLLPAGMFADRFGRGRIIHVGLWVFAGAAIACAVAGSAVTVILARFLQGVGGALILPACLAIIREAHTDSAERTRAFGTWAAWTGAAAAAGPAVAAALVDALTWRVVFLLPVVLAAVAVVLLRRSHLPAHRGRRVPLAPAAVMGLILLIGAFAYLLMQGVYLTPTRLVPPVAVASVAAILLLRDRGRNRLLPRELMTAHNCLPANATSLAFYFGLFGSSFVLVLYVQQVLGYPAVGSVAVTLPMSLMLLFAERLGRITSVVGTRTLLLASVVLAAAGLGWIGTRSTPLSLWSHIGVGSAMFGLGLSLAVSPLTHAAVVAVPESLAGVASGLNHAVVRLAGLIAVALLGSIASPPGSETVSADGVQRALRVCAMVIGIVGVWGSLSLRDQAPGGLSGE